MTLRAGEVATTGTFIVRLPIAPGDRADFGQLGGVETRMGTQVALPEGGRI